MSVHTDFMGPLLFVGGTADGQRFSVNKSHDKWKVPHGTIPASRARYDDPDAEVRQVDVYTRRELRLGTAESNVVVSVMVWDWLPGPEAYALALQHIANLVNGKDRL